MLVRESCLLDWGVEEVWARLRDFNGHVLWHPAIAESRIEGGRPPDAIGAVRAFALKDGARLREVLLELDDAARRLRYAILDSEVPLFGYVAEMRVYPVTATGGTFWDWRSEFRTPPGQAAALARLVREDIQRAGFAGFRAFLETRRSVLRAPVPPPPPVAPARLPAAAAAGSLPRETAAIVVARHGGPGVLERRTLPLPPPGPGEVTLRQDAVGVNFIDIHCRTGHFPLLEPPGVPGMEAAGEVIAAGPGAPFRPGDRVAYACAPVGAYAAFRTMSADLLVPLPPGIDAATAASALLKGVTASFLLHEVHALRAGEVAVVHAAAGGVGQILVQWAVSLGAVVVGTVSTAEKAGIARALGAASVRVGGDPPLGPLLRDLTGGRGADVIFDGIGAGSLEESFDAAAIRGHVVSFGEAAGPPGAHDIGRLSGKSLRLSRPNYGHYAGTPEAMRREAGRFFAVLGEGRIRLAPPLRLPLAEAARAHALLEGRASTGALVLIP